MHDITERKKVEDALKESQQKFESLFYNHPEALVYLDEKSRVLDINPRFTELFGYSLEEIKSRNINDGMIHPENKIGGGKNLDNVALKDGYFNYETVRKKKDSHVITVKDNGRGIPEEDIDKIFDMRYSKTGTGFGLSIVRKIIEAHDGSISVKSKVGEGTISEIVFPIKA